MHSGNVVSYKAIIDKVYRDFGWEIQDEEGTEWLAELLALANVGVALQPMIAYIYVNDGRGDLPFDLHKIEQTAALSGVNTLEEAECGKGAMHPMRWATDSFHHRFHKCDSDYRCTSALTYTVNQGYIFTSFKEGFVAMAYDAIPTDECGYPVIPAEQQWVEAAAFFVAKKKAFKLYLRNEITKDKYFEIDKDRDWYLAQAVNHSKQWNGVDQAESVKNSVLRTIPSIQDHTTFFANMQMPEQRIFRPKSNNTVSVVNSYNSPNPAI